LLISYSHDKLKQAFYSDKPEFEANVNEFLDKEGDNFKTYSNKCYVNSEKHSCLVKVNDKNRNFNSIIDGPKSHFTSLCVYEENYNIKDSGDYDSIDLVEITKKQKPTKILETPLSLPSHHNHLTSTKLTTSLIVKTTTTIQQTTSSLAELDFTIKPTNLKSDSKINPPNVTGCLIIDDKQIEIKLYSESTVVTNNLYYFIEYKLDGSNSSSSLSFQVKKNSSQVKTHLLFDYY
jgi:hypothetical protein